MTRAGSPFPGMDPYLEDPTIWPDFHDCLITYLRDEIQGELPDPYYARVQDRLYLEEAGRWVIPDARISRREEPVGPSAQGGSTSTAVVVEEAQAEVREPFIEIRDGRTGDRVVTVIEVLSPTNKEPGTEGLRLYREKQREFLRSDVNLVEIDLLRGGEHVVAVSRRALEPHPPYDYLVVVRRAARPTRREVYPIPLRAPLPKIAVPLRDPDPDVAADLQGLVVRAYSSGAYGKTVDYGGALPPMLREEDIAWARGLTKPA